MRTLLQLLGVAFWMMPVQRVLTMLGVVVIVLTLFVGTQFNARFGLPGTTLPLVFAGAALMLFTPLVVGGALFRIVSAPRTIQLLPHARGRLLAGMIGVVVLGTLLWILAYWVAFQRGPVQLRPDAAHYLMMFVLTLSFATQCSISIFIASRGPLWALIVIGAWQLPGIVLRLAGADDVPRLLTGSVGLSMVPLTWLVFGIWYMRAARIHTQGWTRMRSAATAVVIGDGEAPATREQAMERWLLGGSTPLRISLQWFAGVAVLVGVQLFMQQLLSPDNPPRAFAVMTFSTLALSFIVSGSIGWGIAARSRGLWLVGGRTRRELHAFSERVMLRALAGMVLPFLAMGVALWWGLPARPALPGFYVMLALLAPALASAWLGLMQVQFRLAVDLICGLIICACIWSTLLQPQITGGGPRWTLLYVQFALVIALRWFAAWRWRTVDWSRAQGIQPLS